MLIVSSGLFGIFLFLTYYMQQTLAYSPIVTGFAFLPIAGGIAVAANLSTIVLMPRIGPKPLVATGMLVAAGAMTWFAQLGAHTAYVDGVLGPLILTGIGIGHGDRAVDQHRHLRRRARGTRASPRPPSPWASNSAHRSAPRC